MSARNYTVAVIGALLALTIGVFTLISTPPAFSWHQDVPMWLMLRYSALLILAVVMFLIGITLIRESFKVVDGGLDRFNAGWIDLKRNATIGCLLVILSCIISIAIMFDGSIRTGGGPWIITNPAILGAIITSCLTISLWYRHILKW